MTDDRSNATRRYVAFISYSHHDRRVAQWLHRALESYRLPRRLRTASASPAELRDRLGPVFLDHFELASSPSLGESVRAALLQSEFLIVLCSPSAARSRWVNEEVRLFKELGREDRILCVLVAGEPGAAERGFAPDIECLPPALRYRVVGGAVSTEPAAEPLACDARAGRRARGDVLLRLAAAMLGVSYDSLRQRDQARRHRRLALMTAASVAACLVLAALTVTALLARNQAQRQQQLAQQKSLTAERTTDFLVSLFKVSDPSAARGNSVTAREILDRGVRQIEDSLHDEPLVRAELLATLGEVYTGLGLFENAATLLEQAYDIAGQPADASIREAVALAELEFQRGDYARAERYLADAELALSAESTPELRAVVSLGRGDVAAVQGNATDAHRHFAAALAAMGQDGLDSETGVRAAEGLALASYYAGDLMNAEREYQLAVDARTALSGATHPRAVDSLHQLGGIAYARGDTVAAEAYFERALAVDTRVLGPSHPNLAATMLNIGRLRLERRQYETAAEVLAQAVGLIEAQADETQPDLIFGYSNLALARIGAGSPEGVDTLLERAHAAAVAHDHPLQAQIRVYQADLACRRGQAERGLAILLREAEPLIVDRYIDEPWRLALLRSVRAGCLSAIGDDAAAAELIESSTPPLLERWPVDTAIGHDAVDRAIRIYSRAGNELRLAYYRGLVETQALLSEP